MLLHNKQKEIVKSNARFKVVRAGRRGGKTTLEIEEMVFEAVSHKDRNVFYIAPTQKQARSIIWEALKSRIAGIAEINEARLEMKVPTKDGGFSIIYVAGWENKENFRGMKASLIVFDELDTMRNFFIGWQEIFRPALTDTRGKATFIGTPKKENPNLRRLEKIAETDEDWETFTFTTSDNPHIPADEIEKAKKELDHNTFRQEYLAEYVDNQGSLFRYDSIVDIFTNTVTKKGNKYLIVDVAGEGADKTVFSFWEDLEEYRREEYQGLNHESIVGMIRQEAATNQIPYSHIAIDAIGIGDNVARSPMLNGVIGFKSSYTPIKTDHSIIHLPNVGYLPNAPLVSEYSNLRSQCVFKLASLVNNHEIASRVTGTFQEKIIEELAVYQDASKGDGKRRATEKDDIKSFIGRSPDHSDTFIMRMYFEIVESMIVGGTEEDTMVYQAQKNQFTRNRNTSSRNSTL